MSTLCTDIPGTFSVESVHVALELLSVQLIMAAPILILFSLLAGFFVIQVNDLLPAYISIELLSLIFYILASLKRISEFSTEAGLKYFELLV